VKYTTKGSVSVQCHVQEKPEGLRDPSQTAVEIIVSDTGCGIPSDKLESIFREFEQVESSEGSNPTIPGVGTFFYRDGRTNPDTLTN
jgi:signal transduction histidine kinase